MHLHNTSLHMYLLSSCLLLAVGGECFAHYRDRAQLQEGEECAGPDGAAGVCASPEKCISQAYEVTKLPPCSASQHSYIICCPNSNNPLSSRHKRYTWHQAPYLQTQELTRLNNNNYGQTHQNYQSGYNYQHWPDSGHAHYGYDHNHNNKQNGHNGYTNGYHDHNSYDGQNWYNGWNNDHSNQNWHTSDNHQDKNEDHNHNLQNGHSHQHFQNRNNGNNDTNSQNTTIGQTTQKSVPSSRNTIAPKTDRNQEDTILSANQTSSEGRTGITTQAPLSNVTPYVEPNPVPAAFIGRRVSERKCIEYRDHMKKLVEEINPIEKKRCAWHVDLNASKFDYFPIYLGRNATRNEFPHMVALGWPLIAGGIDFKCGGALISESYVLTAGHCLSASNLDDTISSLEPILVRLGDYILDDNVIDGAKPVSVGVKRLIRHPSYAPPVKYFDIGLIELAEKVQLTLEIRPACLWTEPGFGPYKHAVVTGWGRLSQFADRSVTLQKASLELFEDTVCAPLLESAKNRHWKTGLADHQLCAGDLKNGTDTCQGDSGSALAVAYKDNQCLFFVVGVTSFGRPCGTLNSTGVYTRVSSFVDWIESVVWADAANTTVI